MANRTAGSVRGMTRVLMAAAGAVLLVAPLGMPAVAEPVGGPATVGADGRPRVHAVVLVDESNSETPETVRQEAEAAGLIATSQQLDTGSKVAVVGFGTDDFPEVSRQQHGATDEVCPLAQVGSTDFRTCLGRLHLRTIEEGNGTDHAAALTKALDILETAKDPSSFNVVFLLTDGGLRVDNVQRYGARLPNADATMQSRMTAAMGVTADDVGPRARALGAQIWPVGFGQVLNRDWMARLPGFGAGTSQNCQKVPVAAPAPLYAETAADIAEALDRALANASCMGFATRRGQGGPGDPVTLSLNIPSTASSATINALKREPGIKVTYTDPRGRVVQGSGRRDGSFFTLNNSAPTSESLFIASPYPGTWKVTFTWPSDARPQTVQADLTWIGQLSSVVRLSPASPKPGESATVHVTLQTSRGEPADPRELAGLVFDAQLAGDGFAPVPVTLTDNGQGGDEKAGDGSYTGQVSVPSGATGLLSLTGSITGAGLRGTVQRATYRIPGPRDGGAVVEMRTPDDVHRGASVSGLLRADNPSGTARQVSLRPAGLAGVSLDPVTVTVPAGASGFEQKLTLSVASDAAYGPRHGVIRVSVAPGGSTTGGSTTGGSAGSAANEGAGVVLTEEPVSFDVDEPPGWLARNWPYLLLAAVVLLLAILAALLLRARRRRAVDVSQLQAFATRGDGAGADLPASRQWAAAFRFTLNDAPGVPLTLTQANPGGGGVYTVRRAKHGQLAVHTPGGEVRTLLPGTRFPAGMSGAQLWIEDRRLQGLAPSTPPSDDPWSGGGTEANSADPFGGGGGEPDPYATIAGQDPFAGAGGNARVNGHGDTPPYNASQYNASPYSASPYGNGPYGGDPYGTPAGSAPPGGAGPGTPAGTGARADDYRAMSEAPTLQPGQPGQRPAQPPGQPPANPWPADDWNNTQF
ncbi:vWA domain-containing protein [Frankia sp. R82]|uniref:vWA domain-containing protein n=1 Tax=Frankia sp. R82 TaxID=2950553 RepID=UPI002042EE3F|nr:choice-of-anchor X domain-containing protein [Frankia sp. R82]MCM3884400.1 hypothetical protein [Frankia sp. R82]